MSGLHRFWSEEFEPTPGGAGVLDAEESRHALRVLRLKAGDRVQIFDGLGREFLAELQGGGQQVARFTIKEEVPVAADSVLQPALGLALCKNEKFDFVVQKATELGVARIVPFTCERSVRRIADAARALNKNERWRRIALSAAKQSGRARLPLIAPIVSFTEALNAMSDCAPRLFCYEAAEGELLSQALADWPVAQQPSPALLIGPEGGFTDEEAATAQAALWQAVSLGARILRCETAALAALTLLHSAAGEM